MHKLQPGLDKELFSHNNRLVMKNMNRLLAGLPIDDLAAQRADWFGKDFFASMAMMTNLSNRLWESVYGGIVTIDLYGVEINGSRRQPSGRYCHGVKRRARDVEITLGRLILAREVTQQTIHQSAAFLSAPTVPPSLLPPPLNKASDKEEPVVTSLRLSMPSQCSISPS